MHVISWVCFVLLILGKAREALLRSNAALLSRDIQAGYTGGTASWPLRAVREASILR